MKKYYLLITFIWLSTNLFGQTNYQANHYMFNQQLVNPASIGKDYKVKAGIVTNSSLTGITGAPRFIGFHLSSPIKLTNAFVGLNMSSVSMGVNNQTEISGLYSYRITGEKWKLSMGLQVSGVSLAMNNNQLKTGDAGDEQYLKSTSGFGYNVGAGVYADNGTSFIGLSVPGMLTNTIDNNSDLATEYDGNTFPIFLSAGHEERVNKNWWLNPYAMLRYYPSGRNVLDLNLMLAFKNKVWAGPFYKMGSQAGLIVGCDINSFIQFSYAGGISQQQRTGFTGSTHEISLLILIKDKDIKTFNSLRFF
ncbi:MAG: type IX secretion system PorP/SprF family membrane protein [Bacteroidia bacterium]|jgi:type IX secretion system PorP/SprF family membrane protein